MNMPQRAHVIAGGFPAGQQPGTTTTTRACASSNSSASANPRERLERLRRCRKVVAAEPLPDYLHAGPVLNDNQAQFVRDWMEADGRWLGLHGTGGVKAARIESSRRRRMVLMEHHEALGGFFISHPPVRRFNVDLADTSPVLTQGLPQSFEVFDEPYMIEVREPKKSRVLLTAQLWPNEPQGCGLENAGTNSNPAVCRGSRYWRREPWLNARRTNPCILEPASAIPPTDVVCRFGSGWREHGQGRGSPASQLTL